MAEVVIITYRTVSRGSTGPIAHLPLPSTYVSTMIIYGGLGLFPESANAFTAAVGWGLVVATVLNLWTPGKVNAQGLPQVASAAQSKTTTSPANVASQATAAKQG